MFTKLRCSLEKLVMTSIKKIIFLLCLWTQQIFIRRFNLGIFTITLWNSTSSFSLSQRLADLPAPISYFCGHIRTTTCGASSNNNFKIITCFRFSNLVFVQITTRYKYVKAMESVTRFIESSGFFCCKLYRSIF